MERIRILIVDDDFLVTSGLEKTLSKSGDYLIDTANSGREAMEKIAASIYDIVITDLKLSDSDGTSVLQASKKAWSETDVVIITGYGSIESAVECLKNGAYDYLAKPIDIKHFRFFIQKIVEKKRLTSENIELKERLNLSEEYHHIVGTSPVMQDILEKIQQISRSDVTLLLCGESGTGKELIAHSTHYQSSRRNKPFISINCGALPKDLFESELFGHEKGAFTGAYSSKKGAFELADGGTLFLDEIGEMNMKNQVDLLRVLEDNRVKRLGGTKSINVDVRIIAATNKDLNVELANGTFRKDLYYRINVVTIHLPPLRERLEDLPVLAGFFLERFSYKYGRPGLAISPEAMKLFLSYPWPGNIRELKNSLERAVVLSKGTIITPEDLPPVINSKGTDDGNPEALREIEKKAIIKTLCLFNGHQAKTAKALGISERTLRNKIKDFGLQKKNRQ